MAKTARLQTYNVTKGVNRTFSGVELPDGFVLDALDVLPRIPGGVQAILGDTTVTAALPAALTDLFPFYAPSGTFYWVARGTAALYYSANGTTWSTLSGVTISAVSGGLHSMNLYRGQLAIAEEGQNIKLWDGATVTALSASSNGGLVAEFAGRLCNIGESSAPSFPTIKLPMIGTGVPLTAISKLATGSGTIASNVVTPSPAPSWTINAYAGKQVVLGGSTMYRVASNTATTFTVTPIDAMPADSSSAVPFEIFGSDVLALYPSGTVDLGQSTKGVDGGSATFRFHNRSPVAVRVVDVRAKGKDFRIEDLTALPATVPPNGTLAFKVVFNPFSIGTCAGTIVLEHDLFAQSSLTIPVTGEGIQSKILVTPSVVDFGEWLIGTASSPISVQIKNPLRESVTLPVAGWVAPSSPFAVVGGLTVDKVILPGETWSFTLTFTPSTSGTASSTLQSTRTMDARRSRLRMSDPFDATKWNHDESWIDVEQGDTFTGKPVALYNYDDALIVFKESEIGAVKLGGEFDFTYSQLTLGKGVGALNQQAVCAGDGSLFWNSKVGIFQATGTRIEPLHIPIDDVVKAIAASDFVNVRTCFYDHCFIWTAPLPSGFMDPDAALNKRFWAYHVPTQGWWPLSSNANAMAVKRGTSDKPAWYASNGTNFLLKDSVTAATTAFMLKSGLLSGGEPGVIKFLTAVTLNTDLASQFATKPVTVVSDNGNTVVGVPDTPASIVLYCGSGSASVGVLTDAELSLVVDELIGQTLEIAGVTHPITANTATAITYTGGSESGLYSYCVVGSNGSTVVPVPCYLKECFGGLFRVTVNGTKAAAGKGNLNGFILHVVPYGEYSGQPGRV